ncbi:16S rRNA (cytidine(1402)-2'-O)-methyltransferase [Cohnella sp. JJ-181]|uniref:16S rRNA (cytidine(1402)-2'-O)-methyltransferase n=1 Tax=Cohnella rhizoplanae TaxID=2974897 RepID=UPI0022FF73C9|nr:16S rRNA (cytidine(1402)-2'-O)-methyltransferase [Cohnella sp. JJ-181]CAI6084826.1 Ribosomal RNA small subunit methyltransferase I [Cohnella sp. JJ-181]
MKGKRGRNEQTPKRADEQSGRAQALEEQEYADSRQVQVQKSFGARGPDGPGTLYLVATPIGNLEDMTFRAVRMLKEADLIAAEDTRQTRKLLTHFEISTRLVSYHEHNKRASGPELVRLLKEGSTIALVSDAGMPAISDPGADLAAEAAAQGVSVVPIPGANAALSSLIVSGLPTDRFLFAGFPPRDRKGLDAFLTRLDREEATILLYESPHRLKKTIEAIAERWAGRRMAVVRELTKKHEEIVRGTAEACLQYIEGHPPLGECCLVIEGAGESASSPNSLAEAWWSGLTTAQHVARYEAESGEDRKEAMRLAARDLGVSRREVYQMLLDQEKDPSAD